MRSHSIEIAAPVDRVFEAVADVGLHARWQTGLVRCEPPEDFRVVGARGAEVRRMFGREVSFPYEITEFEAPRRWGFRALSGPIRPAASLSFEEHDGLTRVESTLTVPGILGALLIAPMLRDQQRNYQTLKRLVEAGELP